MLRLDLKVRSWVTPWRAPVYKVDNRAAKESPIESALLFDAAVARRGPLLVSTGTARRDIHMEDMIQSNRTYM